MLRRVDSAQLVHAPGLLGKGPYTLVIGKRTALVGGRRKWTRAEVQDFITFAAQWPAFVAQIDQRSYGTAARTGDSFG
jgi:hypothetical protein